MPDLSYSFLDSGDDDDEGLESGGLPGMDRGQTVDTTPAGASDDSSMVFGDLDEVAAADSGGDSVVSDMYDDPMDGYQQPTASGSEPISGDARDAGVAPGQEYGGGIDPSFTSLDPIDDGSSPQPVPQTTQPLYPQQQYSQLQPQPVASQPTPQASARPQTVPVMAGAVSHGTVPGSIPLDLIKKIIAAVDVYRHLDQKSQGIVNEFFSTLAKIGKAPVVDDSEAGVVKAVIEIDPDLREGVVDLMDAKNKGGSERAFFLFGMSARRLGNMDLILQMLSLSDGSMKVTDSIDSIRQASAAIDTCLNERMHGDPADFLTPVYDVLKETQKIMEG